LPCLAAGFVGTGSHVLLDFTNAYGIRLLSPVSEHWYAWNIVPIIDVWLWLLLLAFLIVPMLFALVASEVTSGAPPARARYRASAAAALIAMGGWWAVRAVLQARAFSALYAHSYLEEQPRSIGLFPLAADPFRWSVVADLGDRYFLATANVGTRALDNSYPRQMLYKPAASDTVRAAESSDSVRVFLGFARYPLAQVNDAGEDTLVFFTDLRFARADQPLTMGVEVVVDPRMRIVSQDFAWRRRGTARQVAP
jgi:hypothetical protein